MVKKKYRFNNLLHEAHGTGPKLPKGRREIRRGIKPLNSFKKNPHFFLTKSTFVTCINRM